MESNNNNNQSLFLCEFKELRKELSAMKKRIVQLEKSHEKQQERIDTLESENHALKTELNLDGNKESGTVKPESTSLSASTGKKNTKTTNNNNDDDDEAVVIPLCDNGDSFDSLSDDLLHKIVEFDGNCYSKFGSINKRCRNIYDVKEYKLEKETCVYGYGTVEMILQLYLQKRREEALNVIKYFIAVKMIWYNRLDVIDWIIQLGDSSLLKEVCIVAAQQGKINILSKVFLNSNLTILDELLNDGQLCFEAALFRKLKTLKCLRKYGATMIAVSLTVARYRGYDEIVQYLRAEGCPEQDENGDESPGNEQLGSDDEDGENEQLESVVEDEDSDH